MSQALPSITHLQFVILDALGQQEAAGRALRGLLAQHGLKSSAPAFYQMMARLELAGWVTGRYEHQVVEGQHLKERRYEITKAGRRALAETRAFYAERLAAPRRRASHA